MGFEEFEAVSAVETAGDDLFGNGGRRPLPAPVTTTLKVSEKAAAYLLEHSDGTVQLERTTDRFDPDVVAELTDGRILVVEYKGAHLVTGDDAREKQTIGSVWAAASNGRCRFVMVTAPAAKAGRSVTDQLKAIL